MEIIKAGHVPPESLHEHKCKNCRTLFNFNVGETHIGYDRKGRKIQKMIKCPLCLYDCLFLPLINLS